MREERWNTADLERPPVTATGTSRVERRAQLGWDCRADNAPLLGKVRGAVQPEPAVAHAGVVERERRGDPPELRMAVHIVPGSPGPLFFGTPPGQHNRTCGAGSRCKCARQREDDAGP